MPETPALQSMIEGYCHLGRKPVVLLPGLICNERGHNADVCDPVCNDFEPICNDCEPEPKTQLQSICARLSDDCDPAAGCLQVFTYIGRLVRGGFSQDQARASAEALESALFESVATKIDIADLKHEIASATWDLRLEISGLKVDIAQTKNDILRSTFGSHLIRIGTTFAIVKFVH